MVPGKSTADWVKIRKQVPWIVKEHIQKGIRRGDFTPQDLLPLWKWYDTGPSAPPGAGPGGAGTPRPSTAKGARPGDWYMVFPKFIFVGNGDMPQSLLKANMRPWGICLGNFRSQPTHRAKLLRPHKSRQTAPSPVLAGMGKHADAPTPIRYGNVQANLPEDSDAYEAVLDLRDDLDRADFDGLGIKTGPIHITVRYGIKSEDTSQIESYLSTLPPMEAKLGSTESFPPSESSDNAAVLIAPVECPALIEANDYLGRQGDRTNGPWFKPADFEYHPHVTIAYLKPGTEEKYVGNGATAGTGFTIREVTVITPSKARKTIALNGKSDQAAVDFATPITKGGGAMKRAKLLRRGGTESPKVWLQKALQRPDAAQLYVHGSRMEFHEFRQPDVEYGQLLFFTKLTSSIQLSEFLGDNLYLCKLAPGTLFDPSKDPKAQQVLTRILSNGPARNRAVLQYEEIPQVLPQLVKLGYNRFRVFYGGKNRTYDAISDATMAQIVDWRPIDWDFENEAANSQPETVAEVPVQPARPRAASVSERKSA